MSKHDPRLSMKTINKLLANNPSVKMAPLPVQPAPAVPTFAGHYDDFDTLHAVERIKAFQDFIGEVLTRYEGNVSQQSQAEQEEQDLHHAIELADHLTDKEKRMLISRLRACLQVRRACKSENEILQPLYDSYVDKTLYNELAQLQGAVRKKRDVCNSRQYDCRTGILDDFRAEAEGI